MTNKSPRQQMSKKSGKSLKEKRAAKRAGNAAESEPIVPPRKRKGSNS